MNPTNKKPCLGERRENAGAAALSGDCQILEDYANDLRKIIKKLRKLLN